MTKIEWMVLLIMIWLGIGLFFSLKSLYTNLGVLKEQPTESTTSSEIIYSYEINNPEINL